MIKRLIDECGEVWSSESDVLRVRLGFAGRSIDDRAKFLVENLGFISVLSHPRGLVLQWRPTFVSRKTFVALMLLLNDELESRVLISTLRETWTDHMSGTLARAREALFNEFETALCKDGGYFRATQRHAETLNAASALRKTLERARSNNFTFNAADLWQLLGDATEARFALLKPHPEPGKVVFLALGNGYSTFNKGWLEAAPGRAFLDQPDAAYARAASKAFWPTVQSLKPTIEDVDASLWWVARGRYHLHYTRLLLPIIIPGKVPLLLSVAELRSPP